MSFALTYLVALTVVFFLVGSALIFDAIRRYVNVTAKKRKASCGAVVNGVPLFPMSNAKRHMSNV